MDSLSLLHCRLRVWCLGLCVGTIAVVLVTGGARQATLAAEAPAADLDPAAWGSDHVGEELPEFATGEECLFCHREIGGPWMKDPHNRTMRQAEADDPAFQALTASNSECAKEVSILLGSGDIVRFLRPAEEYGKAELLPAVYHHSAAQESSKLAHADKCDWDAAKFAKKCAGCHASGTQSESHAYFSASLDCYTCHGAVPAEHTNQGSLALLSKKAESNPKVVTSICASCHIRTGQSRSTGFPYPNQFVAGDNLFRDFAVDLSDKAIAALDPGDRHILENVRDVVIRGQAETCLACHDVHRRSSSRHERLVTSESCATCHEPGEPFDSPIPYVNHSKICEY